MFNYPEDGRDLTASVLAITGKSCLTRLSRILPLKSRVFFTPENSLTHDRFNVFVILVYSDVCLSSIHIPVCDVCVVFQETKTVVMTCSIQAPIISPLSLHCQENYHRLSKGNMADFATMYA